MRTPAEHASHLITETTPAAAEQFVSSLLNNEQKFSAQEDTLFDYKRDFPHSMSDSYFSAIVRLIFAFHNFFGGIAVLGVDDKTRSGGHNKTIPNIERLNTRLRELSGVSINV